MKEGCFMQDIFKRVFRMSIISSIMFLIFGFLLIFQTENVIKTISIIIGSILLVIGVFPIINYFRNRSQNILSNAGLLYGIFSVVAGIIIMVNKNLLATIIPVLTGVWMIINSVNKIQIAMELRDNKIDSWFISFIFAILILIGGTLLIINPFRGAVLLSKTVGIFIVIYSLLDIADSVFIKVKTKEVKDAIMEAEIVETKKESKPKNKKSNKNDVEM